MRYLRAFRHRRVTLRQRLIAVTILLLAVSMGTGCVLQYHLSRQSLEQQLGRELLSIAVTLGPMIDGDALLRVEKLDDGTVSGLEEFKSIQSVLLKAKKATGLTSVGSPLYIMRRADDFATTGDLEFAVMTDRDEYGEYFIGTRYHALPHQKAALDGTPASTGLYKDSLGLWISAVAPVRNARGEVVGVLQADRPVQYFYEQVREQVRMSVLIALASLLVGSIMAAAVARDIVRPVKMLVDTTKLLADGRFDARVHLDRSDEFRDLEDSINAMARHLCAAQDEQLASERQLTAALHRAEAGSRAKTEFLATMSHEIRTPLNGVIGMTAILLDTQLNREQRDQVQTIRNSGEVLLRIISDILDLSKIEAGKIDLEELPFSIHGVFRETLGLVAEAVARKNLQMNLTIEPNVPDELIGDAGRVRQMLLNLLSNAIKFTEAGGISVRLNVTHRSGTDVTVSCTVQDTGIGLSEAQQSRLFQNFAQADSSTTRKFGGTGLGLAITKRLAESMNGSVSVTSAPGVGSTFVFDIRLKAASAASVADVPLLVPPTDEAEAAIFAGRRVLVAEDNETNQKVVSLMLRRLGVTVEVVPNGRGAVEAFEGGRYDLILIDCEMPEMDGFEAVRRIRKLERGGSRTPVVALTANVTNGVREACLRAGMDDYLSTPVRIELLQGKLLQWLPAQLAPPDATFAELQEGIDVLRSDGLSDEEIGELLSVSQPRLLKLKTQLSQHVAKREYVLAARVAHSIAGTVSTFRLATLESRVRELEASLKAGEAHRIDNLASHVCGMIDSAAKVIEAHSVDSSREPLGSAV